MTTRLLRSRSTLLLSAPLMLVTCQGADVTPPPVDMMPAAVCSPPVRVAPRLVPNSIPTLFDLTRHLFLRMGVGDAGDMPIQTGVDAATIKPDRISVFTGAVYALEGGTRKALPCVDVRVLGQPMYGQTRSRADGQYELAVNGDGPYTLTFTAPGYLPVQRRVVAIAQRYVPADDVVLLQPSGPEMTVDLASLTGLGVVRGERIRDKDGDRQSTLMFRPGTEATVTAADGSVRKLPQITVLSAEYTVGPDGPAAMPGTITGDIGYTYAVEFRVKDVDPSASVRFSKPVINYLEDFIGFPTGTVVPSGFYDQGKGSWVPSRNGRVIEILSIANGLAVLDTNGDGLEDAPSRLSALGIDDAERRELATLYKAGQRLWRVPLEHFTPYDYNWIFGPPLTARKPVLDSELIIGTRGSCPSRPKDGDLATWGVSLECNEAQNKPVAGFTMPLNGTPAKDEIYLRYANDQVEGYTAARALAIPLSGGVIPEATRAIEVSVRLDKLQGPLFAANYTVSSTDPQALAKQVDTVVWDGKDVNQNPVDTATAIVRMNYVYDGVYFASKQDLYPVFGSNPGSYIDVTRVANARGAVRLWKESTVSLVRKPWGGDGLGDLSLSILHKLDRGERRIFMGDGRVLEGDAVRTQSALFAENKATGLDTPVSLAAGTVLGTSGQVLLGKVRTDRNKILDLSGMIAADFLGTGEAKYVHNPALALDPMNTRPATVAYPAAIALGKDDTLYFADRDNGRVRVVKPSKLISPVITPTVFTLAGDPSGSPDPVSALPTQIKLQEPSGLALDVLPGAPAEQSLFIAERAGNRIRHLRLPINPDPAVYSGDDPTAWMTLRMNWIAGTGTAGHANNADATKGVLKEPTALVLWQDPNPSGRMWLLVADTGNSCIRRIDVTELGRGGAVGAMESVIGACTSPGFGGDGGPASQAKLQSPAGLVRQGNYLYIADTGNHRVRRVDMTPPDATKWTITTVAGNGTAGTSCDLAPGMTYLATDLKLNSPQGLAVTDNEIFVTDRGDGMQGCVRRLFYKISVPMAGPKEELDIVQDTERDTRRLHYGRLYAFDASGKHRATLSADRTPLYTYFYDAQGRIERVYSEVTKTDAVRISRDDGRNEVTIASDLMVAGTRTVLTLQTNSRHIQSVAAGTTSWSFTPASQGRGLMSAVQRKDGMTTNNHGLLYDAAGRLREYTDPSGIKYTVK